MGIQFVQIGSDESAKKALLELDDELVKTHGIRVRLFTASVLKPRSNSS